MTAAQRAETGTAIARLDDHRPPAVRDHADVNFGDLMALAKELVPTGFLPDHIKTPGQCAAVILTGRELGMGPMRALRSLQMVKGKVVESADSQLARFKSDGGHAVFKSLTDKEAVLWLKHPNGDEHVEPFTIQDAERAGLLKPSRQGEPSMYLKHPKPMLRSRAITAGLKSIGWEGGAGNYDPEEAASFAPTVALPSHPATQADVVESNAATLSPLDQALAYRLPGRETAWGGYGGRPLGECRNSLLHSVAEWTRKKYDEEPSDRLGELLQHVVLVIEARETGEIEEPAKAGDAAEPETH